MSPARRAVGGARVGGRKPSPGGVQNMRVACEGSNFYMVTSLVLPTKIWLKFDVFDVQSLFHAVKLVTGFFLQDLDHM